MKLSTPETRVKAIYNYHNHTYHPLSQLKEQPTPNEAIKHLKEHDYASLAEMIREARCTFCSKTYETVIFLGEAYSRHACGEFNADCEEEYSTDFDVYMCGNCLIRSLQMFEGDV